MPGRTFKLRGAGDIVKLKASHLPCGKQEWEDIKSGSGFPLKMYQLWAPDHGSPQTGRKKNKGPERERRDQWVDITPQCSPADP